MMFRKLINKHFFPILVLLATIPAFIWLTKPGMYYNMHDDMQVIRQLELEKCFNDGQIPCRWTPDLGYGYGYPLFNFYPPMPYLVGQIFRTFGFSFVTTVKLTAITQIVLSSVFMYILAASVFGPLGGLLASTFYTYAPYHAVNIYVRGAMNEAWASVFFPIIFYFSRKLILEKKVKYLLGLAISFSFLMLSHNPMVLTFTPILFIWCLFWFLSKFKKFNIKNLLKEKLVIIQLALSGVLALSLAAFFTLPVLLETKYVQIETMFSNYYHYSVHFTSIRQLFISNFWGDGASVWGQEDRMSFMVGYLHWILPLIILLYTSYKLIRLKKINFQYILPILIALMGFATAFMTHERSAFLWTIFTPIQKIQFPWRFLNHTVFLMSLSVGFLPFILKKHFNKKVTSFITAFLVIAVIFLNINYFRPITSGPINDEQKLSGKAWVNQITSGIYDYLPKTAKTAAKGPAKEYVDQVSPDTVKYTLSGQKKGTDWMFFNLNIDNPAEVVLSELAFPNFNVYDNNQLVKYSIEPELGRIIVNLQPGEHQIYIKFTNTPIRTYANIISLAAWLLIVILFIQNLWKKLISRK